MTKEKIEEILIDYNVAFTDSLAERLLSVFEKEQEECRKRIMANIKCKMMQKMNSNHKQPIGFYENLIETIEKCMEGKNGQPE